MKLDVIPARNIDLIAYAAMQRSSFADMLQALGVTDSFMTPEFYRWKYESPWGEAKIAVVTEQGEMVASNAMLPYVLRRESDSFRAWQSMDTATIPKARGKGYFSKCINALHEVVLPEELFFGFPNRNSTRGLVKLGWKENCLVDIWVASTIPWPSARENTSLVTSLPHSMREFTSALTKSRLTMIERSPEYLNWRYLKHRVHQYEVMVVQHQEKVTGFVVVREASIQSRKFCLIMELWGESLAVRSSLVGNARSWARQRRVSFLAMFDNRIPMFDAFRLGFIKVPTPFLPKRQVLMGAGKGEKAQAVMMSQWSVQLGDWDGF